MLTSFRTDEVVPRVVFGEITLSPSITLRDMMLELSRPI